MTRTKASSYVCALSLVSLVAACATDSTSVAPAAPPPSGEAPRTPAPSAESSKPAAPKPAVDSNLAWRQGKAQSLAEARAFATRVQAQKLPLTVQVAKAGKRDDSTGRIEQVDAVKNVLLRPLPTDKIAANDKVWADAIRELGRRAAQASSHEPQQIVISALTRSRARITQWLNEGIASAANGQKPDIQFFEGKQAKDTALFYQPLDQKQFSGQ